MRISDWSSDVCSSDLIGRVRYEPVTDAEALASFQKLTKLEGIIPALERAHAIAAAERIAPTLGKDKIIIVNCSGRGDKDLFTLADARGVRLCLTFGTLLPTFSFFSSSSAQRIVYCSSFLEEIG